MVKYYKSENTLPEEEISKGDLSKYSYYYACFEELGKRKYLQLFNKGKAISTVFFVTDNFDAQNVLSELRFPLPQTKIKLAFPTKEQDGLQIKLVKFYSQSLRFSYAIRYYMNKTGFSLKEETLDESGKITGTQRFYFSNSGKMLYAFEYDENGKLFNCTSIETGERLSLEDITEIQDKKPFMTA